MNTGKLSEALVNNLILAVGGCLAVAVVCAETTTPETAESFTVFLVDDQTGEELAAKHGIQPLAVGDVEGLINAVLMGSTPVRLLHQAVDEDSADNAVARMDFRPYAGGQPPKMPSLGLPLGQLMKAKQAYQKERAAWQQGILAYRKTLVAEIERFLKGVMVTQLEVSERFDAMLAARNGRDFNRSDIFGCVTTANRMLALPGRRFLILNTDAQDLPAHRAPRTIPLVAQELDPGIELIFVNTSGLPDQAPLFRGVPNPIHHADSMRAAMEIVASSLKGGGTDGAK
ncbi:MAG TPA: hypothetical protein PLU30_00285 [Verrucomicrobiae bacterium]|nr:hypothetical protein [Verrucomicrobiae bacterium]